MRCEDVQQEFARDDMSPALFDAVASHVKQCVACQRAQLLYTQIDETLQQEAIWTPPLAFAQRVAARALSQASSTDDAVEPTLSRSLVHVVAMGSLAGGVAYVATGLLTLLAPVLADSIGDIASSALEAVDALVGVTTPPSTIYGSGGAWIWVAVSLAMAKWWTRGYAR